FDTRGFASRTAKLNELQPKGWWSICWMIRRTRSYATTASVLSVGSRLIGKRLGTISPVWPERVAAEPPKIALTSHYNCALAAKLTVLELADIDSARRESDLRGVRTAYCLDLEHADALRDAVREFTAINIAAWEAIRANAIRPSCRYIPLAFPLS